MKSKELYDVCVIGAGPSGYACAMRCLDFGNNVCLVERDHLGGAGVMNGAMTSKTMWEISRKFQDAMDPDGVFRTSSIHIEYEDLKTEVIDAAKKKQYQLLSQIETYHKKGIAAKGGRVTYLRGNGRFLNNNELEVTHKNGDLQIVKAKNYVIATGSSPRPLPHYPFDGNQIISSDDILTIKDFPKSLMVIGAGIIGCEFCTIFTNFKKTTVHLLDRAKKVIPFEDDDISEFVHNNLVSNGVRIHSESSFKKLRKVDDHVEVVLEYQDGHIEVIEVEKVFVSIGRYQNTKNLNLEALGIEYEEGRPIKTDPENNCHVKDNIYCVGDASGNAALFNVGEMEGRYCANIINNPSIDFKLRYGHLMPTIMFFKPEVSSIGLNEKQCREKQIPYKVVYYSLELSNRAIALNGTNGFIKLIATLEDNPIILGMRVASQQASALTMYVAPLIDMEVRLDIALRTVHPHPSVTEAIQDAMRALRDRSTYKAKAFPDLIKFEVWTP